MRSKIRIDLQHLRRYLETSSNALLDELGKLEQTIDNEVKKMKKEEREVYYDFIETEHWELKEVMPNFSYASILIAIWSILEHTTLNLAKRIGAAYVTSITLNDLKAKGVYLARKYFEKVLNIKFPNDKKWQEINYLHDIRNLIIHSDSFVSRDKKFHSLRTYIEKTDGLDISSTNKIQVEKQYCRHIINFVESYILEVIDNCEKTGKKIP